MNRTISVTVNEAALIEALEWLRQKGLSPQAIAAIPRMCVEIIAKQLTTEVSNSTLAMFENFGSAGRRSQPRSEGKRIAQGIIDYAPMDKYTNTMARQYQNQIQPGDGVNRQKDDAPRDYEDYIKYVLNTTGVTAQNCSYDDWKRLKQQQIDDEIDKAKKRLFGANNSNNQQNEIPQGCDSTLPIAVCDTPEELETRVAERLAREQEEREAMEKFQNETLKRLFAPKEDLQNGQENG
jgi:hypothetical protein